MCRGVALACSELPLHLLEEEGLQKRVHERGGEKEVRFLYQETRRLLPVWHEGGLRVVRWGSRRGPGTSLPCTGWTWLETVESGFWAGCRAAEVLIPATLGYENGVWFRIRQGIRGVLARDEAGRPVVYMVVEPASHYYQTMTRSKQMPLLVGEHI